MIIVSSWLSWFVLCFILFCSGQYVFVLMESSMSLLKRRQDCLDPNAVLMDNTARI